MSGALGRRRVREQLVPLSIITALAAVAGLGFGAVFLGWGFAWIPVLGAVTGSLATAIALQRRLLVGESIALAIGGFLVVGVVAVGGATPAGAAAFLRGIVTGWAELLTSFTPVRPTRSMAALPFVVAWFGAVVGGELLRVTRTPALPAIGPLIAFASSLLFTIENRWLALAQGVAIVGGTLALGLVQQRQYQTLEDDLTTGSTQRWSARGLARTAVMLLVVLVAAPLLGPQLPLADANERFDLRRYLVPPFDPLSVPSPLTGMKGELRGDAAEDVVWTVRSPQRIDRWPTAVLGTYNGVVWTVAESADAAAGRYAPVDEVFPDAPTGDLPPDASEVEAQVTIAGLDGHWMPRPGWVTSLEIEERDVRFNPVTGNVALPGEVSAGLTYTITAIPTPVATGATGAPVVDGGGQPAALPPGIRNLIADIVQGQDAGWPQVTSVVDRFTEEGFYDASPRTKPGHSFFRLSEFLADPDRIIGYEEQYAAAAGVAVRSLGRPARVVVGHVIPADRWEGDTAEVVGADLSAWIEVRTAEGWVAVDVTPDRSRQPDAEESGRTVQDVAVPNPPPPPPPPPDQETLDQDELDEPETDDEEEPDEDLAAQIPRGVVYVAAGVGFPLLLLGLLAVVVGALKARRRSRRENAPSTALRVAGAWQELLERCHELGHRRRPVDSTREAARALARDTSSDPALWVSLADDIDRAAFHPTPPSDEDAATVWQSVDRALAEIMTAVGWRTRLWIRLDPRPLLRRDVSAAPPPTTPEPQAVGERT